jgi:hypothetical protein
MNILVDLIPDSVEVNGIKYEINTNFRTSILFEMMMQDNELEDEFKIALTLEQYYPILNSNYYDLIENLLNNKNEAIEKILWFYRCGKDTKKSNSGNGKSVKIYDYDCDDEYIYSAFLDQYGIDLQDIKYLHWWKFKAMFNSLKEDNQIIKIMGYRGMDLSKIKDKEQKAHYKKMQKLYEIPKGKTEIDKNSDINKALMSGNIEELNKLVK